MASRITRTRGNAIRVIPWWVSTGQFDRDTRLAAGKAEKNSLADLLAVLGDAEVGECDAGKFTYRLQQRKGYVVKDSSYRVARFKKA